MRHKAAGVGRHQPGRFAHADARRFAIPPFIAEPASNDSGISVNARRAGQPLIDETLSFIGI
jgi:hypothetical protein